LWLDMNEPASWCNGECKRRDMEFLDETEDFAKKIHSHDYRFESQEINSTSLCESCDLNNPPYKINNGGKRLSLDTLTLSMDAVHSKGMVDYDVHNLFGHMETMITYKIMGEKINKGKRPFLITRSTFSGTGRYAGHWTGDNWADWSNLYLSIPGILNFQLFGIPLVGADICGFNGQSSEELCLRWMQLGSFYPFMRNHNVKDERSQEPYNWPSVAETSRKYIGIRYSLLPYYYTLFYEASVNGTTILRPLFIEFPHLKPALESDRQFMLGGGILISPMLLPQHSVILSAYIPPGIWYDFYTHFASFKVKDPKGVYRDLNAPLNEMPIHIRGGYAIPMSHPGMTTTESRNSNLSLLVALNEEGNAKGSFYLDDGESLNVKNNYTYTIFKTHDRNQLVANVIWGGYDNGIILDKIVILGINLQNSMKPAEKVEKVMFNGLEINPESNSTDENITWKLDKQIGKITFEGLEIKLNVGWNLTWVIY
ncbi:17525_t:CDS:2, partial [Acaulospora morrowiae]